MSIKVRVYFSFLLLTVFGSVHSQNSLPEFPGGKDSLEQFILRNLKFPKKYESDASFKDCKVMLRFTVNVNGKVENYSIYQSCLGYDDCDKEALRLIQLMPAWQVAMKDGVPVKRSANVGFEFRKPKSK